MLPELLFYEEFNVLKIDKVFKGYAILHKVKIIEKKDPLIQLEVRKSSIKDLCLIIF